MTDPVGGASGYDQGDERAVQERARYLAASTELDEAHAEALAWRQAGYTYAGIAKQVDSTAGTVADRLDRVAVQYGLTAVETKPAHERGKTPLEKMTEADLETYGPLVAASWRQLATQYADLAPEWFDVPDDAPDEPPAESDKQPRADAETWEGWR